MKFRANEVEEQLTRQFEFSAIERLTVEDIARCVAYIRTIDDYLDEQGLVARAGKPQPLLKDRLRFSRQLADGLAKLSRTIDRQTAEQQPKPATRADYLRELERIAVGPDSNASAHDQVTALKELMKEAKPNEPEEPGSVMIRIYQDEKGNRQVDYVVDEEIDPGQKVADVLEETGQPLMVDV